MRASNLIRNTLLRRTYATLSPHTPPPQAAYTVFDEAAKARQRDRAILRSTDSKVVDYLREEIADRLSERIEDLKTPPGSILDVASHAGQVTKILQETLGDRKWSMLEESHLALNRDELPYAVNRIHASPSKLLEAVPSESVEAVVSTGLHWIGDIVGALTQIRHVLIPDGVFIGAVLGGDTLFELRTSLQLAEQERKGGIANRVSPMINPTDAPGLLSRAGFTLTTVDVEDITINYPSIWELMSDLRDMGESNAILGRRANISKDVLLAAESIYKELHGVEEGIPATFQVIFMIGWKPGPNQPKPLERGSASSSLKDVL